AKFAPEMRLEAVASLKEKADASRLVELLGSQDPFLRSAAVQQLGRFPDLLAGIDRHGLADPRQRMGVLLAYRASGRPEATRVVSEFLADSDEDVRFLAAKWIADQKLVQHRPLVVEALKNRNLNVRMYSAYSTALARLD